MIHASVFISVVATSTANMALMSATEFPSDHRSELCIAILEIICHLVLRANIVGSVESHRADFVDGRSITN